ncbi:MAG: DUF2141 domain-containing protein [Eudoraea sp.]|nr:DUF2141 domain-containing protein [Eudoraea sp.]MBT8210377.1 DUF2141 domain-containing protein [Eudoraea sp.]NNK29810.1 DUF2141 domain-containing protein [Flavobacteriaceae bacterium]
MRYIVLILLLCPLVMSAQKKLTVQVAGVASDSGQILVAVYDKAEGFLKKGHAIKGFRAKAVAGVTELEIDNLPEGQYALAIYHDENGNDELDTNWLGIPKEPIGFSNAKMRAFGPPGFKDCAFTLDSDTQIQIEL